MLLPTVIDRVVSEHPEDLVADMRPNELKGLKATFINMPLRETAMPNTPPEGPAILGKILRERGADVSLLDLNVYRTKDQEAEHRGLPNGRHLTPEEAESKLLEHLVKNGDQGIIAFSGMITTLKWQELMAEIVRRLQPDIFLASGGGLATEVRSGLFKWIPQLDAVAHSDGDAVILSMARDVKAIKEVGFEVAFHSRKLSPYYLGEINGRHRFMYEGQRPRILDSIPYGALDLLETDPDGRNLLEEVYIPTPVWGLAANNSSAAPFSMTRSLTTVSSRGCPHACGFCFRGILGEDRVYRVRSIHHLAGQVLEFIQRYGIDFVGFPDDNFGIDRKRIFDMPGIFRELGINIRWGTHTRLDEADDRLAPMREAGCIYLGFGAESASETVLKRMIKGGHMLKNGTVPMRVNGKVFQFPKTMVDGMRNTWANDMHGNCTWIMGYPGETLADLQTSVAFILWQMENCPPEAVNRRMFMATPYPGTEMFKDPEVKDKLTEVFGISFDETGNPVADENLRQFILDLDDATKVLENKKGEPLYFGAMPLDQFLEAREYVDNNQIEKILDMSA